MWYGLGGKEFACNPGDLGSTSVSERSSGEGNGNPLQYSCLENHYGQRSLVDYIVHGVSKSQTRLSTVDTVYSKSLLMIYFICSSMFTSILIFQFVPPALPPWEL